MSARSLIVGGVLAAVGLSGCGGTDAPVSTTTPGRTSTTASPPTTSSTTTTLPATLIEFEVSLETVDAEHPWTEMLFLPYGTDTESPGNGRALDEPWGPDLPVVRDTELRWWVLDTYKHRIAIFDESGTLTREIPLEPQGPVRDLQVFDDGTALGVSTFDRATYISDVAQYFDLSARFLALTDNDGASAYGYAGSSRQPVVVQREPEGIAIRGVEHFRTRAGTRYSVSLDRSSRDVVVVALPDADPAVELRMMMRADDGGTVVAIVEAVSDEDGSVHLLLYGYSERNEAVQLGAYVHLAPDGSLVRTASIPNPFGGLDPGSPNHLSVDPAFLRPHIAVVDDDGLRVWALTS